MSVNAQVHLNKTEINKKNEKPLKPLFSKSAECSYVSCYCEENVWKLCQDISLRIPGELDRCFVVFISNPCRTVPLWKQRAGREDDRLVIWDYHVIFLYSVDCKICLVYDLDSELPFPTFFHKYVTETFRTDQVLKSDFHRFFRVVPAKQFLQHFASDRRHMKRPDGSWIKPPPPYPAICTSSQCNIGRMLTSPKTQWEMSLDVCTVFYLCSDLRFLKLLLDIKLGLTSSPDLYKKSMVRLIGLFMDLVDCKSKIPLPLDVVILKDNWPVLKNKDPINAKASNLCSTHPAFKDEELAIVALTHNLDEYINMDSDTGPGQVFNLIDFVRRFYKIEK